MMNVQERQLVHALKEIRSIRCMVCCYIIGRGVYTL